MIKKETNLKKTNVAWMPEIPEKWDLKRGKFLFKSRKEINDKMQCKERLGLTLKGVIDRFEGDGVGLNPNDLRTYQIFNESELVFKLIDLENKNTSRVGFVHKRGIMSSAYIRVMSNPNVNMRYFYYQYYDLYQRFIFNMIGQGVRATMSSSDLLDVSVAVPPLEIQNRIVEYLDKKNSEIDNFIQNKERLINLLDEQKATIINQSIIKGLDIKAQIKHSGVEWLGEIPKHWEVKKLRYLGSFQNGISAGAEYFGFGYPFVSYSDVYKNTTLPSFISDLANSSKEDRIRFSVLEGDIFFTRTSETIEEIGFTSVCEETINDATFSGFLIRFRPSKNILHKGYSKYYFRSNLHRRYFVKEMNLVTRASLSQELLKKLPVVIPSYNEQKEIAKFLDIKMNDLDVITNKIKKEISAIKEYREALITDLVTGKRSIPQS